LVVTAVAHFLLFLFVFSFFLSHTRDFEGGRGRGSKEISQQTSHFVRITFYYAANATPRLWAAISTPQDAQTPYISPDKKKRANLKQKKKEI
jgi:hypothetical protein